MNPPENERTVRNHIKKLTYEYLAIFLVGAVEGLTVIGHDERGASEEIDLWIANDSKDSFWVRIGNVFIVECKNWGNPMGVPEVRSLKSIMQDKNIDFSILMSKNGITGDNYHDANDIIRKAVRENKYIVVLDQADLLEIANGTHPTKKIREKYYDLLTVVCGLRVKQNYRDRYHAPAQANSAGVARQEVGARATSRSNSAMPHDPGFQPASHCSQRRWPGHLWTDGFSLVAFFSPFPLHQQGYCSGGVPLASMVLAPLLRGESRGERHDTSKRRRHTKRAASASGWPCRFSPGTGTSPGHV